MPSYRDSTNIDTSRLAPVNAQPIFTRARGGGSATGGGAAPVSRPIGDPIVHAMPPAEPVTSKPVSTLDSSLPVLASGSDIYTRQFYNSGGLPQRRFLPVIATR